MHGERKFLLDKQQAPSLIYVPIRRCRKSQLLHALNLMNVNEMSVYPEIEKVAKFLKQRARLPGSRS